MSSRPDARIGLIACSLSLAFFIAACSSGPAPPAKGSPAWNWRNAGTTWKIGDLLKTSDNLQPVAKAGNEFTAKAQPWRLILTAGLAEGYMDVAEAFFRGTKANQAAGSEFRRPLNRYRTLAGKQAAQFYQTYMEFKKAASEGPIPLGFSYPSGSATAVAALTRIGSGMKISEGELAGAEKRSLQRGVLLAACSLVGAPRDTAKTQQIFGAENPSVPRETFLLGLARKLHEIAGYYTAYKIDQPDRLKLFDEQALEILKSLPETDETKGLVKEVEKELKAAKR